MTDREKFEEYFAPVSESMRIHGVHIFEIMQRKDQQWQGWQAALASQQPADNGWIEWEGSCGGSDQPVMGAVEVRFRSGRTGKAGASSLYWRHIGEDSDIIAYRGVKP